MDFDLTEDQRLVARTVREFVDRDVMPVASAMEHRDEYPEALVETMKHMGLFLDLLILLDTVRIVLGGGLDTRPAPNIPRYEALNALEQGNKAHRRKATFVALADGQVAPLGQKGGEQGDST